MIASGRRASSSSCCTIVGLDLANGGAFSNFSKPSTPNRSSTVSYGCRAQARSAFRSAVFAARVEHRRRCDRFGLAMGSCTYRNIETYRTPLRTKTSPCGSIRVSRTRIPDDNHPRIISAEVSNIKASYRTGRENRRSPGRTFGIVSKRARVPAQDSSSLRYGGCDPDGVTDIAVPL